ncbi:hypothetical protein ACFO6R_11970 [Eubacterium multiforme]|uniref:Twitching motility protein PilT n=1 Tax=Eubacterium multiforme TaxID=83339 RepID=A0ABT9UX32_9FIRM|nr:hypothetical protein [Eubacterium multiforme]MDQ0150851.1 hypothetical protein [Eubacterium multiforme]
MIRVFCNRRGSGKTKRLIELANSHLEKAKGDSVYIDDDSRYVRQLNRKIRFISTDEFNVTDCNSFYGMLCGVIANNYDIENVYVDGLLGIVSCALNETSQLFNQLRSLSIRFGVNIFININYEEEDNIPEFIKLYVA